MLWWGGEIEGNHMKQGKSPDLCTFVLPLLFILMFKYLSSYTLLPLSMGFETL